MNVDIRDGCIIVHYDGDMSSFDLAARSRLEHAIVTKRQAHQPVVVIIDMTQVAKLNPAQLGWLVTMLAVTIEYGGHLVLAGVGNVVSAYLQCMKLDYVFRYYRSVDHAVESLTSSWSAVPKP